MAAEGFNTTCFCYGQTGSGKTHTLTGPPGMVSSKIIWYTSFQKLSIMKLHRSIKNAMSDFWVVTEQREDVLSTHLLYDPESIIHFLTCLILKTYINYVFNVF